MATKELINQYVTAHADNRWMDASELEALLTEFAEKLQEPSSEDLEEATEKAIRWFENIADECDKLTSGNVAHLRAQIKGMAIRSAEYLKKHSQEPASEDLESEWKRYCDSKGGGAITMNVKDVAKYFAQWQKEQMMKDALEARSIGIHPLEKTVSYEVKYPNEFPSKFKKVKVIIIKE